jgi:hypothetical protein
MEKNLFIDIHAIQTIPPSNLNRDDTGSPKTATFGGSQACSRLIAIMEVRDAQLVRGA